MKQFFLIVFLFISSQLLAQIQPTSSFSNEVATKWFDFQLEIIPQTDGFTPPVTARALGYSGITLYEAVVNGMPNYTSLVGKITDFKKLSQPDLTKNYNWAIVANHAMAKITEELFENASAANKLRIYSLRSELDKKYGLRLDAATIERSAKFGETIAKEIYEYSKSDGGHLGQYKNFPKEYKTPAGACMWIPVGNQMAMQPYWGKNRPFVKAVLDLPMTDPPRCEVGTSSLFYAQAIEVYSVGKNLTDEQKAIALFWSDDPGKTFTPPGHGVSIALQILKKENFSLEKAAEVFCKVGIAASDAFIACWKCKYDFNILRPVTYINTVIDPKWKAFLENPPFPEFTSGHASVSSAIAIVLSDCFGYNYAFTDDSHHGRGLEARSYDNFWDYAQEAALSRLYGGIHYRNSNEQGLINGKKIGKAVCALPIKKI